MVAKLKSSRLSYGVHVVNLPFESIFSKISRYEADLSGYVVSPDLSDSVVSFILIHWDRYIKWL
jgi:hypothetical protein